VGPLLQASRSKSTDQGAQGLILMNRKCRECTACNILIDDGGMDPSEQAEHDLASHDSGIVPTGMTDRNHVVEVLIYQTGKESKRIEDWREILMRSHGGDPRTHLLGSYTTLLKTQDTAC